MREIGLWALDRRAFVLRRSSQLGVLALAGGLLFPLAAAGVVEGAGKSLAAPPNLTLLATVDLQTQVPGAGVLEGTVLSAVRREVLAGVTVELVGTNRATATDRTGAFRFGQLAPGRYTVRARFLGLDSQDQEVEVRSGEVQTLRIELRNDMVALSEILVETQAGGQALALNQQRTSETIMNVVHQEQIERFAASNVPSALQRIPGISAAPRQGRGEAENVSIRGLSPNLHVVTVNGRRMASSGHNSRATDLSAIPVDVVSGGIEVVKAFTPDLSGEATSGAVNIVTRRPEGTRRIANAYMSGSYSHLDKDAGYRGGATWGHETEGLSFLIHGNFQNNPWTAAQFEHLWDVTDLGSGFTDVLARQQSRQHDIRNERYAASANLDYYLSNQTSFFGHFMLAREAHERDRYSIDRRLGNHQTNGDGSGTARGRVDLTSYLEDESVLNMSVAAGGRTLFGATEVDYSVGYARGVFDRSPTYQINYRANNVDFGYRLGSGMRLENEVEYLNFDPTDASRFDFRGFRWDGRTGTDENITLALDLTREIFGFGANHRIRAGSHFLTREKDMTQDRRAYQVPGGIPLDALRYEHGLMARRHLVPFQINRRSALEFYEANRDQFGTNALQQEVFGNSNYSNVKERVAAGYLMNTVTAGRWMVLAGVRAEHTTVDSRAFRMMADESGSFLGSELLEATSSGLDLLPAFHVRYSPTEWTNVRFAATRTVGRPGFRQLSPYEVEDAENQRISRGNPDLRTTSYTNFDLLAETYFQGIGIVSGGVFYKSVSDAVVSSVAMIQGGEFEGWEETRPINLDEAEIYGVELAWQQPMQFLPGPLGNARLFANYAYTRSMANYGRDRRFPLTSTTPHVLNLAVLYEDRRNSGSLSVNFNSGRFSGPSGNLPVSVRDAYGTLGDRYQVQRPIMELKLGRRLTSRVSSYAELQNLFNTFTRYDYVGLEQFPYRLNYFSWWGNLGVRVDL